MPRRETTDTHRDAPSEENGDEDPSSFIDFVSNLSNSQVLSVERVEDSMDLKPVPGRLSVEWMPTVHSSPSTFAALSLGPTRLLAVALPPCLFEGRVDPARSVVWWAMDDRHRAMANGMRLPTDALYIGGPGARCQVYWPQQAVPLQAAAGLVLPWALVPRGWPEPDFFFRHLLVDREELGRFRLLVRELLRRASERPETLAEEDRRQEAARTLIDAVSGLVGGGRLQADPQATTKRRYVEIMERIDRHLEAHLDRPILLDEVARELRLAPRSVHNVMKLMRGMTLQAYVRIFKLRSVRRQLLRSSEYDRVKQVALMHGYTHLGRFAQDYAKFFGESPSASLARRRD